MIKLTGIWPSINRLQQAARLSCMARARAGRAAPPRTALALLVVPGLMAVGSATAQNAPPGYGGEAAAYSGPSPEDAGRGVYYGAGLIWSYDSNLLRTSDGPASTGPVEGVAIETASLLAGADEIYGAQRVYVNAALGRVLYRNFGVYDYTSQELHAGWLASLPYNIAGQVNATHTVSLANFASTTGTVAANLREVVTRNDLFGQFDFPVAPGFGLLVGSDVDQIRYSNAVDQPGDIDTLEFNGGVRYQSGANNRIDLLLRELHARYPNADDTVFDELAYRDRGVDLRTYWVFSGASRLEGRLGYVQRRSDLYPLQDFSGPTYGLTYLWTLTGKTSLNLFAGRDIGASGDSTFLSAVTNTYRVAPSYTPTEKTKLSVRYEHADLKYYSDVSGLGLGSIAGATNRRDHLNTEGATFTYDPQRWLHVSLDWYLQRRGSNIAGDDYFARVATVSGTAKF